MKLNKDQLRRIINEAVRARLTEDQYVTDVDDVLEADDGETLDPADDAVVGAMVTQLIEVLDSDFSDSVHEMVVSVTDDNFTRPGRYEDIESFASKIVDKVLADPELKDALLTSAMSVMRSAMRPGEAPKQRKVSQFHDDV